MNKIVQFHEFGGPSVLKIEEVPAVLPGDGEVRIRVDCFALNRAESLIRQNRYFEVPDVFPSRLGYDCAGTVDAVGPDVSTELIGKRVLTLPAFSQMKHGIYGQWAIVPAHAIMIYPDSIPPQIACTVGVQYFTGYFGLIELGGLSRGHNVLITAASSGTALAAMQLAKYTGAKVIVTTRRKAKAKTLLDLGADEVIATLEENIEERVKEITSGQGVDVIYDAVGGKGFNQFGQLIAPFGKIISYGFLESPELAFNGLALYRKGASVHFYQVFHFTGLPSRHLPPRTDAVERAKTFISRSLAEGFIQPVIDRTYPLAEIVEAHQHLESNEQIGKVVILAS
jgi:NADPH:quinone reductase-like Zn-dependent oxidoreductase